MRARRRPRSGPAAGPDRARRGRGRAGARGSCAPVAVGDRDERGEHVVERALGQGARAARSRPPSARARALRGRRAHAPSTARYFDGRDPATRRARRRAADTLRIVVTAHERPAPSTSWPGSRPERSSASTVCNSSSRNICRLLGRNMPIAARSTSSPWTMRAAAQARFEHGRRNVERDHAVGVLEQRDRHDLADRMTDDPLGGQRYVSRCWTLNAPSTDFPAARSASASCQRLAWVAPGGLACASSSKTIVS